MTDKLITSQKIEQRKLTEKEVEKSKPPKVKYKIISKKKLWHIPDNF